MYQIQIKNKYNPLVNVIKNGLFDLKNEIKKMSGDEKENEELNERVDVVEKILNLIIKIKNYKS